MRGVLFAFFAYGVAIARLGAGTEWMKIEGCRLVPNPANDGDSFHVRANGQEYIFRLYLVDAPETDAADPARLVEQAKHFGVSVPEVIEIGEKAKAFVRVRLAEPFIVSTRMADAMGRSKTERFYAFVQRKDGDLGEQLVANGLARIHGRRVKPPGISTFVLESQKLDRLENEAKQRQLGGWAANAASLGTPPAAVPLAPASASIAAPALAPRIPPRESAPATSGKLEINAATVKELQDLPGIGPILAQRIIAARPFRSADDLKKVSGIGDKKYATIRSYFN